MPGVSKRTQYVKPNQAANLGRSGAARPSQAAQRAASPAGLYNPVRPRSVSAPANNAVRAQSATAQAAPLDASSLAVPSAASAVGAATGAVSGPLGSAQTAPVLSETPVGGSTLPGAYAPTEASQSVSSPTSGLDRARGAIRGLTSADISSLLDELASGTLRGTD